MKRFFLFFFGLMFMNTLSFSQTSQINDSLYVWAVSGLNMRKTPDLKGEKILTIPYGERVKDEQYYGKELSLQVIGPKKINKRNYSGFKMTGRWAKVSFMDTVGYVFNGYLSRFPTIQIGEIKKMKSINRESLDQWATRNFELLKVIEKEANYGSEKVFIYGNGIVIQEYAGKSAEQIITIPNITYNETFLLLSQTLPLGSEKEGNFLIQEQKLDMFYGVDLEICNFRVNFYAWVAIISTSCSC